jgi:hypothetical protein
MLGVFPQVSHRLASCRTCQGKEPTSKIYNMDTNCFVIDMKKVGKFIFPVLCGLFYYFDMKKCAQSNIESRV